VTIRFLQTCQSENPAFPFMAGQVISVPVPSAFLLSLVDGVRAEAVKVDNTERAVIDEIHQHETPEVFAALKSAKGRRRRARR
jgi:hypothetical protein